MDGILLALILAVMFLPICVVVALGVFGVRAALRAVFDNPYKRR